ncbi:ATP-dependent DNA helicase [Gudongella sp. DL1XJH-153]|uniref:ATP-dependent DNA helicase n=1 Tax=Gudongella sp. DL1XJH-153 TaxID=3409804 RepID=UPI003BB4B9D7
MGRQVKISVRNLVEYVLRSGDIDNRFQSMSRAVEGTLAHQKVQGSYGEKDLKEVTLKHQIQVGETLFLVEGRADGILFDEEGVVVDEIKSTARDLKEVGDGINLRHWAQAICYAYFYGLHNELPEIIVQLTYFHLETEETRKIRRTLTFSETEQFFLDLLQKYINWASLTFSWKEERNSSIMNLDFPFPKYRRGQRDLAVAAYKTIKENKALFAQAPTGIGKTMSVLYPAIRVMGEDSIEKIFYLTAKTITREIPLYSMQLLQERGLKAKTLVITAKEKVCLNDQVKCNPKDCPYAKGHFDRVNDAIMDIFKNENFLKRDTILDYSRKHQVCPFEFQLDISLFSDVVICDYNYVFDPQVYLKRFFDMEKGEYVFLIDEAHNLVDRSREMFSASLEKSVLLNARRIVKDIDPKLYKALYGIVKIINEYKNNHLTGEGYYQREEIIDLYFPIKRALAGMESFLMERREAQGYDDILDLYFQLTSFIKISDMYDDSFVTTLEERSGDVLLRLFCVDASGHIRRALKRGISAVFFSATLTPMSYFMNLLGGGEEDYNIRLKSPFPRKNLGLMIRGNLSTRYKDREDTYREIMGMIQSFVTSRKGNHMIFFPSYVYMNRVYEEFVDNYPQMRTLIQRGAMNEKEREEFLESFKDGENLVAFAVLGGVFSEGIDLSGDRLIGAVVVGVGMPQIGFERNIIRDYFDHNLGQGFHYAYTYPGMNKVLQAVGRVIRTEDDRGTVLLIDDRYLQGTYKKLIPPEWKDYGKVWDLESQVEYLREFWEGEK